MRHCRMQFRSRALAFVAKGVSSLLARRVSFLSCADKAECADLLVAALDRACVTFLITAAELMPWREWPIFQECAGTLTRGLAAFAAVPLGRSLINKKCCLRFLEPFYLVCMVRQPAA